MTQSQTVTVDQQEILNRANEVEAPMADPPSDVPMTPCDLTAAKNAAQQLVLSAENMREYLVAGAKERQRLATSLRNAAKAYGDVDEEAATALDSDGEGTVQAESAGAVGGDSSAELSETPRVATTGEPNFMDLKEAARKLETGDQGSSFAHFADGWNSYNLTLQGDVKRFRGFDHWEGDAATACEASFDQQREWILHMAKLSAAMAKQAQYVAQLHVWARREHPTYADIVGLEKLYAENPSARDQILPVYAEYQQRSEKVLTEYNNKAALEPVNPPKPPAAIKIDPPPPAQEQGLIPGFLMPPADGSGTPTTGLPATPMVPPTGAGGGGLPAGTAAELTSAGREAAAQLSGDVAVKAASLGGGGGGAPSMPLGPAMGDAESVRPAAAGDIAGAGQGRAPGGAAMGGGGMGMPMGGAHQGQGGSKTKGSQQDDEALYTEDRAWTEAVIGNRRRQDSKESK
ncbi:type VII secretion system ESX-1 target EspB [Mycobacterium decipiens]|uniref:Secretion protein EspB n=1 Tax=Mycobacterium decipiens TaxID=1430326 RepID=A0A1X2LRH5_9MYCO|nr:type VII secretion system ESX-1 target EspB [Mycobacterium decipiens]OSC39275.1 secretion protein EspB [Mycobacterium decipiens]